jgi:spore maturation protein CgeB
MKIVYSFNKKGFEADYWQREIGESSNGQVTFIPFNHDPYLDTSRYLRAQQLDERYYDREPGLMRMYDDIRALLERERADALIVDNCFPYHPEFLRTISQYKVLRTSDGPLAAYDRDFAYVHAYDHVLYHSPAYSRDLGMEEKLRYVGARRCDFWPLALFDRMFDPAKSETALMTQSRDVDIVFVGALFVNKMPVLARVKKAFGKRVRLYGLSTWKRNLYFNAKHGFPGWVRPIGFEEYVPLYQSARIGINVHNRGMYTVGSFRLLELPANGVMQISDGGPYLSNWFDVGREVVGYEAADDLVAKIAYYLDHEEERARIALAGYRAVLQKHRLKTRMTEAASLIRLGMAAKRHEP